MLHTLLEIMDALEECKAFIFTLDLDLEDGIL